MVSRRPWQCLFAAAEGDWNYNRPWGLVLSSATVGLLVLFSYLKHERGLGHWLISKAPSNSVIIRF